MRFSVAIVSLLLLAACGVDTTGLSAASSRTPAGNPSALVTVSEYGDLQCPACKAAHSILTQPLLAEYGSKIRFEFKHFPLQSIHVHAMEAAQAAECAADQGKFWEFLDLNYAQQADLSSASLRAWAKDLGLDGDLFDRCVRSGIKKATILADYKEGEAQGVNSTPTYFVSGVKATTNTIEALKAAVEKALGQSAAVPL